MSNVVTYRLVDPAGGVLGLCDLDCSEKYIVALATRPSAESFEVVPTRVETCLHCAWCGECVAVPVWCRLHDSASTVTCPDFNVFSTLRAQHAVTQLRERAGGDLTPRAFEYLERAAVQFRDAGIEGTRKLLVSKVWDSHIDWLA